jgi:hypothetical protein
LDERELVVDASPFPHEGNHVAEKVAVFTKDLGILAQGTSSNLIDIGCRAKARENGLCLLLVDTV